jgi:hypothetical protein
MWVRVAVAAGLVATVAMLVVVLAGSPVVVAGDNGVPAALAVAYTHGAEHGCQPGGTVPRGTSAVRVSLSANAGPSVRVRVLAGSRVVSEGSREAGWGTDETVTIPIVPIRQRILEARVCTSTGPAAEAIQVNGTVDGSKVLLRMEYLLPGHGSWLSLAGTVAHNLGVGHAPGGAWIAVLLVAAMLGVSAVVWRVLLAGAG